MLREQQTKLTGTLEERQMEDHTANLNGVDIHYRTLGEGPTIFLPSPGWGVASSYLQKGFHSLAQHSRLVFIDTRGSGRSNRPVNTKRMGTVNMADDLEALRVHLGLSEVSVLGHSNGGAIVLSYAERYADRVSKLVLIDTQVLGINAVADTQRILQERSTDPRFAEPVKIVSAFFSGKVNPAESDASLSEFVAQVLPLFLYSPEKTLPLAQEHLLGPISSFAFLSQFAADVSPVDQTELLDQIKANVLILVGRHDYVCPVALSERLHQGIPDSKLMIFEESGHLPWLEEPKAFFAELNNFLTP